MTQTAGRACGPLRYTPSSLAFASPQLLYLATQQNIPSHVGSEQEQRSPAIRGLPRKRGLIGLDVFQLPLLSKPATVRPPIERLGSRNRRRIGTPSQTRALSRLPLLALRHIRSIYRLYSFSSDCSSYISIACGVLRGSHLEIIGRRRLAVY
jgi:hypothetical protein